VRRDDEKVFESLYCACEMGTSCGGKREGELPEENEAQIGSYANLYEEILDFLAVFLRASHVLFIIIIIIRFVRLLALRPPVAYCASLG
jgi:hypothetical protein